MSRTEYIRARVSPDEKKKITKQRKKHKLSESEWVRHRAINPIEDLILKETGYGQR